MPAERRDVGVPPVTRQAPPAAAPVRDGGIPGEIVEDRVGGAMEVFHLPLVYGGGRLYLQCRGRERLLSRRRPSCGVPPTLVFEDVDVVVVVVVVVDETTGGSRLDVLPEVGLDVDVEVASEVPQRLDVVHDDDGDDDGRLAVLRVVVVVPPGDGPLEQRRRHDVLSYRLL